MMKHADEVRAVLTDDGAVLLDTERGVIFDLNRTGALLWRELPRRPHAELVELLQTRFPTVDRQVLAADVDAFLRAMIARRLVVPPR
jgi:hypothetical protein